MRRITKKISVALFFLTTMSVVLSACYEQFEASTYAPKFTIGGFTAVDEIAPDNLVAYWSFDGTLDESVSDEAGTNAGASFVGGFKGQALGLNVANKAYATFDPGAAITGLESFTISFWVNPTFVDADGNNGIDGILGLVNLSKPDGFWGNLDWFVENDNPGGGGHSNNDKATIKVHVQGGATDTWVEVANYKGLFGQWTSHTLTYDAGTSKFVYYINGSKVSNATSSWGGEIAFANSGAMVFGCVQFQTTPSIGCCGHQDWASYLTGSMDEVRIYNTALSDVDVNALVVLQGKGK